MAWGKNIFVATNWKYFIDATVLIYQLNYKSKFNHKICLLRYIPRELTITHYLLQTDNLFRNKYVCNFALYVLKTYLESHKLCLKTCKKINSFFIWCMLNYFEWTFWNLFKFYNKSGCYLHSWSEQS